MKLKKILEPKLPATYQVATSQDFIDGEIYQAEFIDKTLTNNQRTIFSGCSFKNTTFEFFVPPKFCIFLFIYISIIKIIEIKINDRCNIKK